MGTKKDGVLLELKKLDQKLIELLEELKQYNDVTLNRKPAEDAWSVLQIMHHLVRAEGLSVQYLQKKIGYEDELKKAGIFAGARSILLKIALKYPFRIKAPQMVGEDLPENSTFWEVVKQWKGQREELRRILESLDEKYFTMELFKHPIAGKMNLVGMMNFFKNHFSRHRKQILKTVEKSLDISKILMQEEIRRMG